MRLASLAINRSGISLARRRLFWVLERYRVLWFVILASLLLSGCMQYEAGVNFDSSNRGEIVQHIRLSEQLTSFSGDSVREWLNSIERRTRQLQGKTKRVQDREITVTIPFNNGAELAAKFNEFFNPDGPKSAVDPNEVPNIESQLRLAQNNLLLLVRNRLSYDLDLRSLSLFSTSGNIIVSPSDLLDLEFSLNTPWGARSVTKSENAVAPVLATGHQLVWKLKPGEMNHIEAVFWLPSPIGIGTVLIVLFVAAGIYVRYKFMPDPRTVLPTKPA